MRIVSLLPASTEIIYALGLRDHLVGRSHECDFPRGVQSLPALTRAKIDSTRSSGEVNREVTQLLEQGLSVYEVDVDLLKTLQPDIIITQSQCEACAVDYDAIEKAARDHLDSKPRIVDLQPDDINKVWEDFEKIGAATGHAETARQLIQEIKDTMGHISINARAADQVPTVAMLEWLDPLMAAGNWMPQLVKLANGKDVFSRAEEAGKSHFIEMKELADKDPDCIILIPCGYSMEQTRREMDVLAKDTQWQKLSAVENGRVYLADGNQYFNRPGPRLSESLRMLAEILHPGLFEPLFEDSGWVQI